MKKATRSILEELNNLNFNRNKEHLIETTGVNLVESAINLFEQMSEHYSQEEALELERRFINSVKSADPRKFKRGIQKINESKKNDS
jgi:hypothetical protein|tara:strand:+ start:317 stop:577 length:261 start_codon:yes stop_codon:yes gene_type:complete